ncbi:MAG: hypothetical protein WCA81_02310, partial [Rhizomicrobium sp.]
MAVAVIVSFGKQMTGTTFPLPLWERVASAKREPGEHLCLQSSIFWGAGQPGSVLCHEGVGKDKELSGDGDEGDL